MEIYPVPYSLLKPDLNGIETDHQIIWDEVANHGGSAAPDDRLFIQIGYDEIALEDLDRLLGYENIINADNPIGLPCEFDVFAWRSPSGNQLILYPLRGLYAHFKNVTPNIYAEFEAHGTMDAFVSSKGDAMTNLEYLVGGCMECISYCNRNRFGLVIRW